MGASFRDALKKAVKSCKDDNVDLVSVFRDMGVVHKIPGEKLFKRSVESLIKQPNKKDKSVVWAKTVKQANFNILYTPKVMQYWLEAALNQKTSNRLLHFYEQEIERMNESNKRSLEESHESGEEEEESQLHQKQKVEHESTYTSSQLECISRFSKMEENRMWRLSTGKIVEMALFNLSHYFILDTCDSRLVKENVFTIQELREISETNIKLTPDLPANIKSYLNCLKLDSFKSLRKELYEKQSWQVDYDHEISTDLDWIHISFLSLLRELQSGNLNVAHLESWYNTHIWKFIDSAFDSCKNLSIISILCSKNIDRVGTESRKKLGHRFDLVIRTKNPEHSKCLELGGGECGPSHQEPTDSKRLNESKYKLPIALQDMIDDILSVNHELKGDVETVGISTYGLSMDVMWMDCPKDYIYRLKETTTSHTIETSEKKFSKSFISCLYLMWSIKARVEKLMRAIDGNEKDCTVESWIEKTVMYGPTL
ncbi:hypothetical protein BDA99DRAFT_544154 [Phascolomyces articulosus]|uniref:Uncharacterized protein n=1 Tax=Phascolomyces articulosus TaxID=60185 RepID=A0AAD5P735_9FUNG|nr:hypothetical protein BDA99DRAFT_544154 [Phascolomyces articulosus]